jgi:cytochrome c
LDRICTCIGGYTVFILAQDKAMLRTFTTIAFAILMLVGPPVAVTAMANGTPDQAKAMVEKAAKLLSDEGSDKAFPVIDDPKGPFVDGDLYVFVLNLQGTTVAHGTNKLLIGKSLINVKDADGKLFVQDIIALGKDKGEGWVDYKWPDPVTKKVEAKSSFPRPGKRRSIVFLGAGVTCAVRWFRC